MHSILLLGGRAPATLELARLFQRAGHRVVTAESVPVPLTAMSRAVARHYHVPAPAFALQDFAAALTAIINAEAITFLVATCEEIFHVARIRHMLPANCKVFVPPLPQLHTLHHKGLFIAQARGYGLAVPDTVMVTSDDGLAALYSKLDALVLKPVYSRFAGRTLIRPTVAQVQQQVRPTPDQPWVAQQYLHGQQWCTYSIAHEGTLTAHVTYPAEYTAGQGAAVAFRSVEHSTVRTWVETFVAAEKFTGQLAFDFIESATGEVYAIECNPRTTSGVHLLATHPQFVRAFFDPTTICITPAPNARAMLGAAMLLYGSPKSFSPVAWRRWWDTVRASRDAVWRGDDPTPMVGQFLGLGVFLARAVRRGISPLAATTWDIEWNGEGWST